MKRLNSNCPILSVIIPTYNRYDYLRGCLKSIISIKSDDLEVIVQDNTEINSEIVDYIDKLQDCRIRYFHISKHISVSDNCDEAMKHAKGEYICMIGDDDTICSSMVGAAFFCKEHLIDAASFLFPGFNWPDMVFIGKEQEPNLFFTKKADGKVLYINHYAELKKAIDTACGLLPSMPRVYHGLVSRECMYRIYEKTGSFFPGPSPDMANAAAVCIESRKSVFISDYLMVSGYGYMSARGEGNRQAHYGKLDEKPWLPVDILSRWDRKIPPIFSGETITADSLTESLRRMNENELLKEYNYSSLYAIFLGHHKNAFMGMLLFLLKQPVTILKLMRGIIIRLKVRRYEKRHKIFEPNFCSHEGVADLIDAQKITDNKRKELNIKNYSFVDGGCK